MSVLASTMALTPLDYILSSVRDSTSPLFIQKLYQLLLFPSCQFHALYPNTNLGTAGNSELNRQQVDMRKAEGEVFIPQRVFLFL